MLLRAWTIVTVLAVAASSRLVADSDAPGGEKKDKKESGVRALKFAPKEATVVFGIGGKSKLTRLADAEAVEKLLGAQAKADAKALAAQVDFQKEAIVLVSWTTSGPPDGVLKHEVKGKGIVFYVQGPPAGGVRGQRARIAADFFAVPRDAKVSFEAKER